jgi:hypothetical protein
VNSQVHDSQKDPDHLDRFPASYDFDSAFGIRSYLPIPRSTRLKHIPLLGSNRPGLLWQRNGCVRCHGLLICLGSHNLAITDVLCQQLEVVDIERRSKGVDELGLLVRWIGKGVRCSYWHDNVVTSVRVNCLCRF